MSSVQEHYDPVTLALSTDRGTVYRRLHREAPVFYSETADAWIVTRYDDIRQILGDTERISAVGSIGITSFERLGPDVRAVLATGFERVPGIIEMDPPDHTQYRNLVGNYFAPTRVGRLEDAFRDIATRLVTGFESRGTVDLIQAFAFPYPLAVICHVIGIPLADVTAVDRMSDGFRTLEADTIHSLPLDQQIEAAQRFVDFQRYAAELVARRRAEPRGDLISEILTSSVHGRAVTDEEAISWVIHLLFAGHETNARSLATTIHRLLSEPDQWRVLVADQSRAAAVVEEGLRLEPPVTFHTRTTTKPIELSGTPVPAGATLHLVFAAGNRDDTMFAQPERFDPGRAQIKRHLGFGWGIHHCIGAPVARLESRVALEVLVERLPGLALAPGYQPTFEPHAMLRGLESLPVVCGAPK
jgi:cytochrome P450